MSPTDQRMLCYSLAFAVALLLVVGADANANNISWKLSAGGAFSSTNSWVGGVVPEGGDYALFGLNNGFFSIDPFTVSFTADAKNFGMVVGNN